MSEQKILCTGECGLPKPISKFQKKGNGRAKECNDCRNKKEKKRKAKINEFADAMPI